MQKYIMNILCKNKVKLIPSSYPVDDELKCSCGSIYNDETKKKIISRLIEHQQESIKGNWSSCGASEHTKECHDDFDLLHPTTFSIKNRHYDRKVRKSLETDMVVVRYGQDKVLNRDNFVETNAWKSLFIKVKAIHWNLTPFCIKWWFCIVLWSVWKRLQPVWLKYQVVNSITCVVLLIDFEV